MTTERKKRRWWRWVLGGIVGLVLLVAGTGYVLLDIYAADIVRRALADADLPNPRLEIESIGLSTSVLRDVAFGDNDEVAARAVELEYDIFDLIDLDTSDLKIRLVEPVVRVSVDETGALSFGSLDPLLEGDGGEAGPIPFESIELQAATLYTVTPEGPVVATVDGTISNEGEQGLGVDLTIRADNDIVLFDGDVTLLVGSAGAIEGRAEVRALDARTPWANLTDAVGSVALRWTGDGIPVGEVDLTVGTLEVPARLLPPGITAGEQALALSGVSVAAKFDGGALDMRVGVNDASGENGLGVDVTIPNVFSGGYATISGELTASGDRLLWPAGVDWVGGGGLTASFEAELALPALPDVASDPVAFLERPSGEATVQWLISDVDVPDVVHGLSSVGDVSVSLIDGIASLRSAAPVEIRADGLDQAVLDGLVASDPDWAPIAERDLSGRIDIAFEGRSSHPLSITITRDESELIVRGDFTLLAATGNGPLAAAEISGRVAIGDAVAVRVDDMVLFASDIATPGVSVGVIEAAGSFSITDGVPDFDVAGAVTDLAFTEPQMQFARMAIELAMAPEANAADDTEAMVLAGPLTMSFTDSGGNIDDVRMEGLSGELTGRVAWGGDVAQLFFTENAVFRVDVLDIEGDVIFPESSLLRVSASENPVLELDFSGESTVLRHSLNIGPLDMRGTVRMGDEHVRMALTAPQMLYEGGYDDGYVLHIVLSGVNATAPSRGWTIGGATVTVDYSDNDPKNLVVVAVNAARAQSSATEGLLPPVGARVRMDYGLDDVLRFTGRVFKEPFLIADATAVHDLNTSRGSARFEFQDLIFTPGVMQPSDISPVLTGFENVTGTVDVVGGINWAGSTVSPDLAILVSDVNGEFDAVEFTRMNSVIELESFDPFRTKPDQLLSIATVDPGVPISNAEVLFRIEDGHILIIDKATLTLAEGAVEAVDQALDFDAAEQEIDLVVTGVDLLALLRFADLEDVQAEGTLDGIIPITIVDGDVVILDATLSARAPGFIRYDSGEELDSVGESNAGVDLMVEVLRNFLFQELDLSLTRPVAGDMDIGFHILGYNPDVYGGVPIDLVLTLDGELEDVIRNSLEIYRVPETIQDLILEYGLEAVPTR